MSAANNTREGVTPPNLALGGSPHWAPLSSSSLSAIRKLWAKVNSFFTFDVEGKFRKWPLGVILLFAALTVASIGVIVQRSMQRSAKGTSETLQRLNAAHCPWISTPQLPVAFTAWRNSCANATTGSAYVCNSTESCVALGTDCAPLVMLRQLECIASDGTVLMSPQRKSGLDAPIDGARQATQQDDANEANASASTSPQQQSQEYDGSASTARAIDGVVTRSGFCAFRPKRSEVAKEKIIHGFCTSPHAHCALCVRGDCIDGTVKCLSAKDCGSGLSSPWSCATAP